MTDQKLPVYRIVDGELVRIPGDRRDPNRRYSSVSGPQGNYLREFTDEEERQRDEEEAKWEAERPQREAEAKRQAEDAVRFRESLKYKHRVIAFLDVLGWSDAIKRSIADPKLTQQLGITLEAVRGYVKLNEWTQQHGGEDGWPGDPQITHFSDCIIVSVAADTHAEMNLVWNLRSILSQLLRLGFVVRGGIAQGQLIHRGPMVYGPALIQAYELEKKATAPRVILDPILSKQWGRGTPVSDTDGNLLGYDKLWRQDDDGWAFFDFLQPFPSTPPIILEPEQIRAQLEPVRSLIISRLDENKSSMSVYAKYCWMSRYFNCVLDDYPNSGIAKIAIY